MTTARQVAETRIMIAMQARIARKHAPAVAKVIRKMLYDAASAYEVNGDASTAAQAVHRGMGDMKRVLDTIWANAGGEAGKLTAGKLKCACGKREIKAKKPTEFATAAMRWMRENSTDRIRSIEGTTLDDVKRVIDEGFAQGYGSGKIASAIRKLAPELSRTRAEIIARTETHAGANVGSFAAAESIGVEMKKVWIATEDDRTREAHQAASGQSVDLQSSFVVDSENLMFPGDPSGSPGNVIACRCAAIYEVAE